MADQLFALQQDMDIVNNDIRELKRAFHLLDYIAKVTHDCELEQLAQGAQMRRMETRLDNIEIRIGKLEERMDRLEERMDRLEERMDRLEERMDRLEERMDRLEERMDKLEYKLEFVIKQLVPHPLTLIM